MIIRANECWHLALKLSVTTYIRDLSLKREHGSFECLVCVRFCSYNGVTLKAIVKFYARSSIFTKKSKAVQVLSFSIRSSAYFMRLRTKLKSEMCLKLASIDLRTALIVNILMQSVFRYVAIIFWY